MRNFYLGAAAVIVISVAGMELYRHSFAVSTRACIEEAALIDPHTLIAKLENGFSFSHFERGVVMRADDGSEIARKRLDIGTDLIGIYGGAPWFSSLDAKLGAHRRSPTTLEVERTQPEWATGAIVPAARTAFAGSERGLGFQTEQGTWALFDPESGSVRALDKHPGYRERGIIDKHYSCALAQPDHPLAPRFSNDDASVLTCSHRPPAPNRYLHGKFLTWAHRDHSRDRPAASLGDEFLVIYQSSLSNPKLQLARVGCDGVARWTAPLDAHEVIAAFDSAAGPLLIVHENDRGDRALLIDAERGAPKWSRTL